MRRRDGTSIVDPWERRLVGLYVFAAAVILSACLGALPGQEKGNPTPPDATAYCCAVEAVFGDEECTTRPVVPQPAWDRAIRKCREGC